MHKFANPGAGIGRRPCLALLAGLLARPSAADGALRLGGTGLGVALLEALAGDLPQAALQPSLGSGGGIKALGAGALDMALSSRPLTSAEQALGLTLLPWLTTPLVWATAAARPDTNVTRADLAALYAGTRAQWPDGQVLRPVLRPESDSDTALIRGLGPDMAAALALAYRRPGVRVAVTDQDAAADLARIAGALGSTALALVALSGGLLKALALDGVAPAPGLARYPLHRPVYLVMRHDAPAATQAYTRALCAPPVHARLAALGCQPQA